MAILPLMGRAKPVSSIILYPDFFLFYMKPDRLAPFSHYVSVRFFDAKYRKPFQKNEK